MDKAFWIDRWQQKQIGFHLPEVNPHLLTHWCHLSNNASQHVFVPLCGKTMDLIWLAQQGHRVTAVEFSDIAVNEFFAENTLEYTVQQVRGLKQYESGNITIFQGDFFELEASDFAPIDCIYDRAALIALPEALRADYARQLRRLAPSAEMLLISMEYEQDKMPGPPFSVTEAEIRLHYAGAYGINRLHSHDVLKESPRFKERGLSTMTEQIYKLTPSDNEQG